MSQAVVFCCNNRALIPGFKERTPFCLMPVGGRPLVLHILDRLAGFGMRRALLVLDRLPSVVMNRLGVDMAAGSGTLPQSVTHGNLTVEFFHHSPFLGIAESLVLALDKLERDFVVLPRLALPGADLPGMMREHVEKKSSLTWLTSVHPGRAGGLETDPGCVALCMNRDLLGESPPASVRDGEELVARYREQANRHDHFRAVPFPSIAHNQVVDDVHSLWRANMAALEGELPFLRLPERQTVPGIRLGEDCVLDKDARLIPPVIVGDRCVVEAGATVGPGTVLGEDTVVKMGATVISSVVLRSGYVSPQTLVHSALVGNGFMVRLPAGELEAAPACAPPATQGRHPE